MKVTIRPLIGPRFSGDVIITPRGPAERQGYATPSPPADAAPPVQARPNGPESRIAPERPVTPESVPPQPLRPPTPIGESSTVPKPDAGEKSLLRIDILVWAPDAKDRLVYVNGRKYVEGDTMEDGAVIEQIVQDGVVVFDHDQRVLIRYESRQTGPAEEAAPR